MVSRRVDLALAAGLVVFGVWLLVEAARLPASSIPDPLGEAGFVRVLAFLILVLSAYLVGHDLWTARREAAAATSPGPAAVTDGENDEDEDDGSSVRAFIIFGALFGYVFLLSAVGYLLATPLFLFVGLLVMHVRSSTKLIAIPLGVTAITYGLFVGLFGVLLPLGVFGRWNSLLWFQF